MIHKFDGDELRFVWTRFKENHHFDPGPWKECTFDTQESMLSISVDGMVDVIEEEFEEYQSLIGDVLGHPYYILTVEGLSFIVESNDFEAFPFFVYSQEGYVVYTDYWMKIGSLGDPINKKITFFGDEVVEFACGTLGLS